MTGRRARSTPEVDRETDVVEKERKEGNKKNKTHVHTCAHAATVDLYEYHDWGK